MKEASMNNWILASALLCCTLFITPSSYALSTDKSKPITIEADWQEFTNNGEINYRGNVIIHQGSIEIKASKVTIIPAKDNRPEQFVAQGNPASYQQQTDQGELVTATAEKVIYDASIRLVKLFEAQLQQGRHQVESEYIEYDTVRQNFTAKRAKTVRFPAVELPQPKAATQQPVESPTATDDTTATSATDE